MSTVDGLPRTLRCPTCVDQDLRSTVTVGIRTVNMDYRPDYYNEDGNLVMQTSGYVQHYECSNRHGWDVRVDATIHIHEPKRGPGRPKKAEETKCM